MLWVLVGPITVLLVDIFMLLRFPCFEPRLGWLSNIFRLQKLTETIVEAPTQLILQVWIFDSRTFIDNRDDFRFPFALCFSICTSTLSLVLSLQDIKATANAQGITFLECLQDLAFVGLGRRAPLVHQLCEREGVVYDDEGPLTDQQVDEICQIAQESTKLTSLSFSPSNELSIAAFEKLTGMTSTSELEIHINGQHFFRRWEAEDGEPEPSFVFFDVPPEGFGRLFQGAQHVEVASSSRFGVAGCKHLKELPQLPSLQVGFSNRIGPDGCRHLKEVQGLTRLIIFWDNNVGAAGLRHLRDLPQLRELTVYRGGNDVGSDDAEALLEELRGRGVHVTVDYV